MTRYNLNLLPVDGVTYYVESVPNNTPSEDLSILAEVYTALSNNAGAACWNIGHVRRYNFYFRDGKYVRGSVEAGKDGGVELSYRDFLRMIGNQNINEGYEIF